MAKKKKSSSTNTAVATKQPTGLAIARSGGTITFSWNIGDADYKSGQNFYWDLGGRTTRSVTTAIGTGDTSRNVGINIHGSYKAIGFGVQGKRANYSTTTKVKKKKKTTNYLPTMSGWATKSVSLSVPPTPSVSFSLQSANEGTFSWEVPNVSDSGWNIYSHFEWESILVNKHNSYTPPANWNNAARGSGYATSGSWYVYEDTALFVGDSYSYTRWFRVKSVGPAGSSPWRYSYHTYSLPRPAHGISATLTRKGAGNGYICVARWTAPESFMYPVETATVQYAIAKPVTTSQVSSGKRVISWSCPSGASWSDAGSIKDTGYEDALTFPIDRNLEADEAVFVRIVTKHDSHTIPSAEVMASGGIGYLEKTSNVQIQPNAETHRVNVTATNPSDLTESYIAIYFRLESEPDKYKIVGILPKSSSSITVQCPDWGDEEVSIGTQTMLADYSPATPLSSGVTEYILSAVKMKSPEIKWEETIPMPPKNLTATAIDASTIRVTWEWSWRNANQTELSWADHEDAWESTDEPTSYTVNDLFASRWNIAGVDVGTWYVRARHVRQTEELTQYGLWSDPQVVKLSSAPAIPALTLSDGVVVPDGEVTCYWAYVSTDGTAQMQADICEAILDPNTGTYTYEPAFAKAETAQHLTISVADRGWLAGEKHYLSVRVISASGEQSEGWSTPIAVHVADPINCSITTSSLEDVTVLTDAYFLTSDVEIDDSKTYYTRSGEEGSYIYTPVSDPVVSDLDIYYERGSRTYKALTELPFDVTVSGAGIGSTTTLTIERSAAFHMNRPDESNIDGYEGETIFLKTFDNDGTFVINKDDLIGYLDDRAQYRLIATARDTLGQIAEDSIEFEVHWDHQAIEPYGRVEIDEDYDIAVLTPILIDGYELTTDTEVDETKSYYKKVEVEGEYIYEPVIDPVAAELSTYYEIAEGTAPNGDVCDIYRLSIDKPELVYENAEFGKQYVDPYPTIGSYGGYRFVYKTYNGDYTTNDGHIAWYNTSEGENAILDEFTSIINYGGDRVSLPYNLSLSNKWAKDFQQTNYLGGHIQGDWNPAVSRTGTITSVGVVNPEVGDEDDVEVIEAMRRLAVYPGICHVRTPDGSSYAANVDVSEDREQKMINQLANYSLTITKVDSEGLDGMTLKEWQETIADEE